MASESSTPPAPKSKQERIRDNQRRSRARRQEYLAELEQRLKECNLTCREAELQRAAFADLQAENARLKDLLGYLGISTDVVENFGRQTSHSPSAYIPASAHRVIRPKYHPPEPNATKRESIPEVCYTSYSSSPSVFAPTSTIPTDVLQIYPGQPCPPLLATSEADATSLSQMGTISPITPHEWTLGHDGRGSSASVGGTFCCDSFHVPASGPLLPDNGNTIQCSMAKAMVDKFDPSPAELAEIKSRLATAFSLPTYPEPGCRVDIQVLCTVLQEMNAKK